MREYLDDTLSQYFGQTEEPVEPDNDVSWGHVIDAYHNPTGEQPVAGGAEPPGSNVVAGIRLPTGALRGLLRSLKPSTRQAVEAANEAAQKQEASDVAQALKSISEEARAGREAREVATEAGITPEGAPPPRAQYNESGINTDRLGSGSPAQDYVTLAKTARHNPEKILATVERSEQLADVIEAIGKSYELTEDPRTFEQIRKQGASKLLNSLQPLLDGNSTGLANDRQIYGFKLLTQALGDKTAVLAQQIAEGNTSTETLLQYEQTGQMLISVVAQARSQTREIARALSAHRMIAHTLNNKSLKALEEALKVSGADPAALVANAKAYRAAIANGEDPMVALTNSMKRRTWMEASIEFWKSNFLSGPLTHAVNTVGLISVASYETLAVKPLAAVFGETRKAFGAKDVYGSPELAYSTFNSVRGIWDGLAAFGHTIATGESLVGGGGKDSPAAMGALPTKLGEVAGRAGEVAGNILISPLRLMRAEDELFKTVLYRQELAGLAAREGASKGLTGNALGMFVERRLRLPPETMHQQALQHAKEKTFQGTNQEGMIGALGESVARFAESHPVFQFLIPFVRTTTNVLDYSIEASALSVAAPSLWKQIIAGGPSRDVAMAKMTLGSAMTVVAYQLYQQGIITGNGPENREQRAALEATGWRPNAVKVGDKYRPYNRLDPFAATFSSVASAMDVSRFARREQDVTKQLAIAASTFGEHMLDSTFMFSFNRAWQALNGIVFEQTAKPAVKFVAGTATGFVPFSSLLASESRTFGSTEEKSTSMPTELGFGGAGTMKDVEQIFNETFAARSPWHRDELRPKRYWDGTVAVPDAGDFALLLNPMAPTKEKHDTTSEKLVKNGISVKEPLPVISVAGISLNVLDLDKGKGAIYDKLVELTGQQRRVAADKAVQELSDKPYPEGPNSVHAKALNQAILKGTNAGRALFLDYLLNNSDKIAPPYDEIFKDKASLEKFVKNALTSEIQSTPELRFRGAAQSEISTPALEF